MRSLRGNAPYELQWGSGSLGKVDARGRDVVKKMNTLARTAGGVWLERIFLPILTVAASSQVTHQRCG
ncbi:MAG: hypothetical protein KME26_15910 [Oscillatoria princeps RMCB-10]|nr:hypothetical protein [Oscillatoria princeps RMCB-10]